jgi:hypothetical protein
MKLEAKKSEILYKLLQISQFMNKKQSFDPINDPKEEYIRKP